MGPRRMGGFLRGPVLDPPPFPPGTFEGCSTRSPQPSSVTLCAGVGFGTGNGRSNLSEVRQVGSGMLSDAPGASAYSLSTC
eukprot:151325-Chlamydomonas_euryale.AAC.2